MNSEGHKTIHAYVEGSRGHHYRVTIEGGGSSLRTYCTCPAFARGGMLCRHVADLLVGDVTHLLSSPEDLVGLKERAADTALLALALKHQPARRRSRDALGATPDRHAEEPESKRPRIQIERPELATQGWHFYVPVSLFGEALDIKPQTIRKTYKYGKEKNSLVIECETMTVGERPLLNFQRGWVFYQSENDALSAWKNLRSATVIQIRDKEGGFVEFDQWHIDGGKKHLELSSDCTDQGFAMLLKTGTIGEPEDGPYKADELYGAALKLP